MGYFILGFIGFSVLFALMMYWANQIATKYITRILDTRFTSLEQIVNDKRVPDDWLRPFRKKLAKARNAGGDAEPRLTRLGQQTQQRCLRQLEGLLNYTANVNFTDTRETKDVIIREIKAQRNVWETMDWQAWIAVLDAPEAPLKTEDESPADEIPLSQNL